MNLNVKYKKSDNPLLFDDDRFEQLFKDDLFWGGHFLSKIIPIKGQTWLTEAVLKNVTAIMHYNGSSWALRVSHGGDPYAGHIGTAFSPFIAGEEVIISNKAGKKVLIKVSYVHPILSAGVWVWRVEYRGLRELD